MALSNWDTLAFDTEGQPCSGDFKHHKLDNSLHIYKNWVYVSASKMWQKDCKFTNPIIASINSGSIEIAGFDIESIRGSQSAIFVYAHYSDYEDRGKSGSPYIYRFAGIGCYGYKDTVEEVLKSKGREIQDGDHWIAGSSYPENEHYILNYKDQEKIVYWDENTQGEYDYSKDWLGVLPSTVQEFFEWLSKIDPEDEGLNEWIEKCKLAKAVRYNQGDMYFAQNANIELPATSPGEAEAPVINEIIKHMKEE